MNPFLIKTAEACSVYYDPNYTRDKSVDWKSLIISSDECGTTYGPSPFVVSSSISIIFGIILFLLFKKLKIGIQRRYLRIIARILIIPIGLIFLWSILINISFFVGIF